MKDEETRIKTRKVSNRLILEEKNPFCLQKEYFLYKKNSDKTDKNKKTLIKTRK